MCSIHKAVLDSFVVIAVAASLFIVPGCQAVRPAPPPETLNTQPLLIDEAMQLRDWGPTTAFYQSGATVAGPTLFPLEPDPTLNDYAAMWIDAGLFVGQTVGLPIAAVITPPWTDVTYRGIRQEPSYTAVPPLQTDTESMAQMAEKGYR